MDCPSCNAGGARGVIRIVSTRQDENGEFVTRRRRCTVCGFQWFSVEIVVDDDQIQLIRGRQFKSHYHAKPGFIKNLQRHAWTLGAQAREVKPFPAGSDQLEG